MQLTQLTLLQLNCMTSFVELLDEDTAPYYAAEVNGDSAIDSADAGAIELHDQFVELLSDQNVLAEAFNSAW